MEASEISITEAIKHFAPVVEIREVKSIPAALKPRCATTACNGDKRPAMNPRKSRYVCALVNPNAIVAVYVDINNTQSLRVGGVNGLIEAKDHRTRDKSIVIRANLNGGPRKSRRARVWECHAITVD